MFTVTRRWECLCVSLEIQHSSSSTLLEGEKNLKLDVSKRKTGTVLLYPYHPHSNAPELSAKRAQPKLMIFTMGEDEDVWVTSWFPAVWNAAKEAHFFLTPSRIQRRAMQLRTRDADPTNCFMDSIRKLVLELLRMSHGQILPIAQGNSYHSTCITHTQPPFMANSLCTSLRAVRVNFCRQLVNTHTKLSWVCGIGESTHIGHLAMPRGKQKESCQHASWLCKIERRRTTLMLPLLPRRNKKCEVHKTIKFLEENVGKIPWHWSWQQCFGYENKSTNNRSKKYKTKQNKNKW